MSIAITTTAPPRSPDRSIAGLIALAAAFTTAFVAVPPALTPGGPGGGQQGLTDAVRQAFAGYWSAGGRALTPDLQRLVDYWVRYLTIKAVFAALLLVTLVILVVRLRNGWARIAAGTLALGATAVLMANVQGILAPFNVLVPMVVGDSSGGQLDQIRQQLTTGPRSAALDAMVDNYSYSHLVMVYMAGFVALVLIVLSVRLGRWRGLLTAVPALAMIVLAFANATTVADPVPKFLMLFQGGW